MRREDNLRQSADATDFRVCLVCWGRNADWGAGPETNLVFHTTPIYDSNSAEFQIILVFVVAMTQWKWTIFLDLFLGIPSGLIRSDLHFGKVFFGNP